MGHNSVVVVRNDALDTIERHGQEFASNMVRAIYGKRLLDPSWNGDFATSTHANPAQVVWNEHADWTGLIAVGGNHGTVIGRVPNRGLHRERDQQIAVLQTVAYQLGFNLVPRKS